MEQIEKRAKQLYEIDVVLFDGVDLPVLIPDKIIESQKALTKKSSSPKKARTMAAAKQAAAEAQAAQEME